MNSKEKDIYKEMYPNEERERIEKTREINEKLENLLNDKKESWNKEIEPLFDKIRQKLTLENAQDIMDVQTYALSYRQKISEEISYWISKRTKEDVKLKIVKQERLLFYSIGFGYAPKVVSERATFIDAHIAENQRLIDLLDNHVDFLRATSKNLESLGFTIKNIIDLMNYLGK